MDEDSKPKYVTNLDLKDKIEKLRTELKLWIIVCTLVSPFLPVQQIASAARAVVSFP